MTRMRRPAAIGMLAALTIALTACIGLPVSGDEKAGLLVGDADTLPDITQVAEGPQEGASPSEIVEGFLDAALTPTEGWQIARSFLSPDLAATWRPSANVTIDAGAATREFSASEIEEEDTEETIVQVTLDQVANVDADGAYAELSGGSSVASFTVARNDEDEWRITTAADGIVLDAESFPQVFRQYSLQYYDQNWSHLIPDSRWFPRRPQIAATLTQALLSGQPSEWLAPAVRSAFPSDVTLATGAVSVSQEQVADVELSVAALELDATELSRMRTQLEETLRAAGVNEVRLLVNGRDLDAGRITVETSRPDSGPILLTASEFGAYLGEEITSIPGISPQVVGLAAAIVDVDVAADNSRAAVLLDNGAVYTVADGNVDELDSRPGLLAASMDQYGYTWTVPASAPQAVRAWTPDVSSPDITNAFPEASSISQLRVGPDGVRIAAVVTVGNQRWVALAAIIRDADGVPNGLGQTHLITQLSNDVTVLDMSWVGEESLSVLTAFDSTRSVLTQDIGGPGELATAPGGARSLSGGRSNSAVRILDDHGVLFAQRGSTWQMGLSDVLVLGTHAGQ